MNIPEPAPHPALPARESAHTHRAPFSESARTAHSVHPSSTFRRDETIEFAPKPGEDALIGQAPVRPRGRSSSSSTNNHRISSKQQRSSSITNSPDPSIIISDAAEPTAAGSRGANCVVMADLRRLGGPPVGTDQGAGDTGARSANLLRAS